MTVKLTLLSLIVLTGFIVSQKIPKEISIHAKSQKTSIPQHFPAADIVIKDGSIITALATTQTMSIRLLLKNSFPAISYAGINTAQSVTGNYFQ